MGPRYHKIARTGVSPIVLILKASFSEFETGANTYPPHMAAFRKTPNDFYIGSIRNPCDYYVSLWSYGAENEIGQIHKELAGEPDGEHYFNVSENKKS